ncbi:hypothetical protein [Sphingomonas jatrophae]|uniref:Uncharacterized protein n=1 Tax=Sphingomonas jatrophae TaxID=1166337 RepID=A0A1I6JQ77_9SPHN|nr:hypothetical protein [Sphingomonas jatrophae]SFR81104.1 hypothetical protein SAMN05192580_0664 [Sphingomonas jatrophae]
MDETTLTIFIVAMIVMVIPLSSLLAWRIVARQRARSEAPPSHLTDGALDVPVRALTLDRNIPLLGGYSTNNASPEFAITDEGVRFKILKPALWRFEDVARVGAPRRISGRRLSFHARQSRQVLSADLADADRARDLLRALPRDLILTDQARMMRDGA